MIILQERDTFIRKNYISGHMDTLLLLILIIIGNLSLYWILFGQRRFQEKYMVKKEEPQDAGTPPSH